MTEEIRPKGRPKTKYISQIIINAGFTTYREIKDIVNDK